MSKLARKDSQRRRKVLCHSLTRDTGNHRGGRGLLPTCVVASDMTEDEKVEMLDNYSLAFASTVRNSVDCRFLQQRLIQFLFAGFTHV